MCKDITAKLFKETIAKAFGERVKDVLFTQTTGVYYADYRPQYPLQTAGDFLIVCDWITGKLTMRAETATVPTTREFESLEELVEAIKGMDY